MGEKFLVRDLISEEKDLLAHIILHSCNELVIQSMKGEAGNFPAEDARYIEIEFVMNGIEVKFSEYVKELELQLETLVQMRAEDLINERVSDFSSKVSKIGEEIGNAMFKIANDNGIPVRNRGLW